MPNWDKDRNRKLKHRAVTEEVIDTLHEFAQRGWQPPKPTPKAELRRLGQQFEGEFEEYKGGYRLKPAPRRPDGQKLELDHVANDCTNRFHSDQK